ncbi:GNAT family N-acetyltransferase [Paenibacillus sedimenti]|uniref:GNAT family N-acetyltransferase n=1 Tax=Paenibacillus sedimenti TaxID=2770274 RepID=A0A926QIN4_9BACL|nr:GNAT family N-acetyltransferase [Paenibacillus sedimenti]MBD0380831.1 GNAT family N-acetyltransferase [Paenibacillus sedimenti]
MEWCKDGFVLTDDKSRIDMDALYAMLSGSYWASKRSKKIVEKSLAGSLCLSLFTESAQIGFVRVITDYAVFAWICDVIVNEEYRGLGLGKWMMACMMKHPDLQQLKMALATKDAHGLYEQYGFVRKEFMVREQQL